MLMKGPTRWGRWWNLNGSVLLLMTLVAIVALVSLIMRQLIPS